MSTQATRIPAEIDEREMQVIRRLLDIWYERPAKDDEEERWIEAHMEDLMDRLTVLKERTK